MTVGPSAAQKNSHCAAEYADELGALGVRVNAVAPGIVATEISAMLQQQPEVLADYQRICRSGGWGQLTKWARQSGFYVARSRHGLPEWSCPSTAAITFDADRGWIRFLSRYGRSPAAKQ